MNENMQPDQSKTDGGEPISSSAGLGKDFDEHWAHITKDATGFEDWQLQVARTWALSAVSNSRIKNEAPLRAAINAAIFDIIDHGGEEEWPIIKELRAALNFA